MILDPDKEGMGMKIMSMVSDPAIMVSWAKFSDNEIKLSIQDEEQRIVFGPALIPNLPIKRAIMGQVFFVSIDEENILNTAIKFQKDGIANKADTNHDQNLLSGVTYFETFVTNPDRVQVVKGFESLPMGTWFLSAKVENDAQWAKIKSGEITGFSIDANFSFELAEQVDNRDVQAAVKNILNSI